jgi:hypothetical protein
MANGLLNTVALQVYQGESSETILNFIINLKDTLIKSLRESKKYYSDSERSYNISEVKYSESKNFHEKKEREYGERLTEYKTSINQLIGDTTEILNKNKEFLLSYSEKFQQNRNLLIEDISFKIKKEDQKLEKIIEATKLILDNNDASSLKNIILNGLQDDLDAFILKEISTFHINPENKEQIINMLYSLKTEITIKRSSLIQVKDNHQKNSAIIQSNLKSLLQMNHDDLNLQRENNHEKNQLTSYWADIKHFHAQSLKNDETTFELTKSYWESEKQNYKQLHHNMSQSIKSILKIKKLVISSFEKMKNYITSS